MAAASSIKDFSALALPYLEANPTTHYYNLMLHPFREVNEAPGFHTLPEGTLLTWIDRFLITSKSKLDHTFGSWNNVARSLPLIQYLEGDVRRRLSMKVFNSDDATPQEHGDFNDPPCTDDESKKKKCTGYKGAEFWSPDFWKRSGPQSSNNSTANLRRGH